MEALRCPPDDASVDTLSGGEKRRVALCKLLLEAPDMLLLDEPTNHLDAETIAWLQKHLIEYKGTILIVTHDRYFLDDITRWILELDRGRGIPYEGNYSAWLEQKAKRLRAGSPRGQGPPADPDPRTRMDPPGRQGPPGQAEGPHQRLQRARRRNPSARRSPPPRSSSRTARASASNVIAVENLEKHYGDRELIDDLTFALPPGGIVGVIGPNGAGKTTLFRMLTGQEAPDAGTVTYGESVQALLRRPVPRRARPAEDRLGGNLRRPRRHQARRRRDELAAPIAAPSTSRAPTSRRRSACSPAASATASTSRKLLRTGGNVLLLDEPTNDLDVETLRALEDALDDFAGCAVVISHDRFFLDRICTHMLAFEGDAHVEWFEGNFEDYEADKIRRLGPDAVEPKRIKYKKFAR